MSENFNLHCLAFQVFFIFFIKLKYCKKKSFPNTMFYLLCSFFNSTRKSFPHFFLTNVHPSLPLQSTLVVPEIIDAHLSCFCCTAGEFSSFDSPSLPQVSITYEEVKPIDWRGWQQAETFLLTLCLCQIARALPLINHGPRAF